MAAASRLAGLCPLKTSVPSERERELAIVTSRRREVEEQAGRKEKLPSAAKLLEHLETVKAQLLGDEARAAVILRQLLDRPIRVIPYMRIDGKRVVPRLEFTINLVSALLSAVAGHTYKDIAKECGLTKYHMENCARITRLMEEAGLPEPDHRLTEKPAHVPQWCSKHWLKAGDRKGGGRHRRAS